MNRMNINPEAYNDALQKIQDTGHPVFIPGSPFVSIEARCCVNTMPEIQLVDIPNTQDFFSNRRKIGV